MNATTYESLANAAESTSWRDKLWAPLAYEDFKADSFFPSLDGLRAVAVLLVIFVHYGGALGDKSMGWLGVQAFFVLSGFLITTLLLREQEGQGTISLGRFYLRRAFRIMPVYYVVLGFVIWQSYWLAGESWSQLTVALPYYLTFFNEQTVAAPWKLSWTLGVEWKFYLVWPLLCFFVARTHSARLILGTSLAILLLVMAFKNLGSYRILPSHYAVLLMGAVLAIVMHGRTGFRVLAQLTRPIVALVVFVAFFVMQAQAHRFRVSHGDLLISVVYSAAVMLLIPAILGTGLPRRLLSSRPFVYIGQRSYSLYLLQILASQATTGYAPWREHGIAYAALTAFTGLILADFLLRYLERPMIFAGRKLEARWFGPSYPHGRA